MRRIIQIGKKKYIEAFTWQENLDFWEAWHRDRSQPEPLVAGHIWFNWQ